MKAFCEKMKEKVSSDEYLAFLEYFHDYNTGRITMDGFQEMVKDLLEEYPGFYDEFLYVSMISDGLIRSMESAEGSNKRKKSGSESDGVEKLMDTNKKIRINFRFGQKPNPKSTTRNKKEGHLSQASRFCEKVGKKASSEDYLALLKCLHDYGTGKITMVGVKVMVADYFPDFVDDFVEVSEFYGSLSRPSSKSEEQICSNKGKKPNKNMGTTQIDDELTESYEFLPQNLLGVQSSGIDELGKEVLNFICYSKGSLGSGRVSPKDPHEEMLNKHEDELFEMDMLAGWLRSTKENATKLSKAIEEGKIRRPNSEDVNNYFTSYNFRVIEKMYKDHGSQVVDQLRLSPQTVLSVLIKRLNQMELMYFTCD